MYKIIKIVSVFALALLCSCGADTTCISLPNETTISCKTVHELDSTIKLSKFKPYEGFTGEIDHPILSEFRLLFKDNLFAVASAPAETADPTHIKALKNGKYVGLKFTIEDHSYNEVLDFVSKEYSHLKKGEYSEPKQKGRGMVYLDKSNRVVILLEEMPWGSLLTIYCTSCK